MDYNSSVSTADWLKGISLSVLASLIGGASKLAIRKSWLMEAELNADSETSEEEANSYAQLEDSSEPEAPHDETADDDSINEDLTRRWAWCLRLSGMIGMTFFNPLCCVLAMNYASPSILAPFSGLTLAWIVLFSNVFIGEQPSVMQVAAASLIVIGEIVVAIFGDHTNDEGVTLEDLVESYREPAFIAYFFGITFWMLLLAYWMRYSTSLFLKRFAWGVAGGSITGLQNFLKDTLTILKAKEGYPWYLALMVFLAIATAFVGLLLLTACMKRYDATYSSSMFVGSFVVSASIMSALHYQTFQNLDSIANYIMYPIGLAILMAGVVTLVKETKEGADEQVVVDIAVPTTTTSSRDPLIQSEEQGRDDVPVGEIS